MSSDKKYGRIELIIGPMGAGKSGQFNRDIGKHKVANRESVCIKPTKDVRFEGDSIENPLIVSRDGTFTPAMSCDRFLSAIDEDVLNKVAVIGIDEGQSFYDLADFSEKWANRGKIVIITALNSTFQRKPFGDEVSKVYAICEKITLMEAVCTSCGEDAFFSKRLTDETELEVIGDKEYTARCRKCFMEGL
jgi:thymidine kinase